MEKTSKRLLPKEIREQKEKVEVEGYDNIQFSGNDFTCETI